MKEVGRSGVQTKLVEAARDLGGVAWKLNNRFTKGVPDLCVQLPSYPTCLIEVKVAKKFSPNNIGLTVHQWAFIRAFQRAEGFAGWCVVTRADDVIGLTCGTDADFEQFYKLRNNPWPILQIVRHITRHATITYSRS